MTRSITLSQLLAFDPCNREQRIKLFKDRTSITVREAVLLGVSLNDLLWVAGRLDFKAQIVEFAQACAQRAETHTRSAQSDAAANATRSAANAANAARSAARSAANAANAAARSAAAAADAAAVDADAVDAWAAERKTQLELFVSIMESE
jgi:hypothetical protein